VVFDLRFLFFTAFDKETGFMSIDSKGYAHPDVLVSTEWVAEHMNDPNIRIVESDEDVLLYNIGHIPGSIKLDWHTDLNDPMVRDYIDQDSFRR
jgi:thiosulfate/3-mercaptopyruvate sulfurtransferase